MDAPRPPTDRPPPQGPDNRAGLPPAGKPAEIRPPQPAGRPVADATAGKPATDVGAGRRLPPTADAFRGIGIEDVVADRLPTGGWVPGHDIRAPDGSYVLKPQVIRQADGPHVAYYAAWNPQTARVEFAVGPAEVDIFLKGCEKPLRVPFTDISANRWQVAAGNYFGLTGGNTEWQRESARVVDSAMRGDFGATWRHLKAANREAAQDPGFWLTILDGLRAPAPAAGTGVRAAGGKAAAGTTAAGSEAAAGGMKAAGAEAGPATRRVGSPESVKRAAPGVEGADRGPLVAATDPEIDAAVQAMTAPKVKGSSRASVDGHRVPPPQPERLDIQDVRRLPGETQREAVARVREVIGKDVADYPEVRAAWERARDHATRAEPLDKSNHSRLYDRARERFWQEVRADPAAQRRFEQAGFRFPESRQTAPTLPTNRPDLPATERRLSLDHKVEKARGENWRRTLDADNLRFELQMPNSNREHIQVRHPELRQ
ncbi:hypothetical protein [Micromonospora radicis]|uniref:Uncharacterized protein n=1 Tax=Micromonospora radicis TaxID=1894971 RepID=A0A418MY09_9ACTN|nr:hypothetical protein [Micromonospora radicis]RIV39744.1 hypothetical protein D2L64_08040 [Micromonospora radicis]